MDQKADGLYLHHHLITRAKFETFKLPTPRPSWSFGDKTLCQAIQQIFEFIFLHLQKQFSLIRSNASMTCKGDLNKK